MATIESYKPGSFVWAELASSDPAAAKAFYGEMFGWTYMDAPMPMGVYTIFQSDGNDAAALYQAQQGMPPNWGVYFSAPDLDASSAKAVELGGEIVAGPMDAGEPGRMTIVKDPQGVHFTLWQAKRNIGITHGGPLNRVMWPELATPEPAGAIAFYSGLLGWTTKPETGAETAPYVEFVNHGESFGGLMPMKGDMWQGVPPHWMIYITVADCDERAARAASLGGKVCVPPTDIPNVGRFSVISDAQGATFSIIKMAAMQQPATA
jgi:predicted enzyme related to lactoylglutathione lyase